MKIPLLEVQNKIDYEDYTLKEEDDITLLGGLEEEKILKIELISPLDNTMPQTIILDLDEKAIKS